MTINVTTRELLESDPLSMSAAFAAIGWSKPIELYERYLREQEAGIRAVRFAEVDGEFAGYVNLVGASEYPAFLEAGIPEIQDLNVLPKFRGRGIGSRLLDEVENIARADVQVVGLGVGLHPGYNTAQRLYVMRGFVPDGKGVTWRGVKVREGDSVTFDDELLLWLTKRL